MFDPECPLGHLSLVIITVTITIVINMIITPMMKIKANSQLPCKLQDPDCPPGHRLLTKEEVEERVAALDSQQVAQRQKQSKTKPRIKTKQKQRRQLAGGAQSSTLSFLLMCLYGQSLIIILLISIVGYRYICTTTIMISLGESSQRSGLPSS